MDTVPHSVLSDNFTHYTYVLMYPEDYPQLDKSGTVFYVGKGSHYRIDQHEREAKRGGKSYKCNVIRKIWVSGGSVVKKKLAYFYTHKEAMQYEIALIFFLPNLTNETAGGEGLNGHAFTDEHKRKIGEKSKGKHHSPDAKRKLSLAHTGKKASPETRTAMSISQQGRKHPQDVRAKISAANKGREISPESIAKRLASTHEINKRRREETQARRIAETERKALLPKPKRVLTEQHKEAMLAKIRGIPMSAEHRAKIGAAHKGRPRTVKQIEATIARSVKRYDGFISPDGTIYRDVVNLSEFCRQHDLRVGHMIRVHKGNALHHKGWHRLLEAAQEGA